MQSPFALIFSNVSFNSCDVLTPYATATKFTADTTYQTKDKSSEDVFEEIKKNMLSENLFSAVKISGKFKNMHVRMMPGQEPPYTRLIDSARRPVSYTHL